MTVRKLTEPLSPRLNIPSLAHPALKAPLVGTAGETENDHDLKEYRSSAQARTTHANHLEQLQPPRDIK